MSTGDTLETTGGKVLIVVFVLAVFGQADYLVTLLIIGLSCAVMGRILR
jgi:hypothetical protein